MRVFLTLSCLILVFHAHIFAQERVAEGEYRVERIAPSRVPEAKIITRWVVYAKSSGSFHLESEIENQPAGMRVVQVEDLTDRFVPTAIGYELYRKDQQTPSITANCDLTNDALICSGRSGKDEASRSTAYKRSGPFWPWIEGLGSLDLPWLLDGALNMANWSKGRAEIATVVVSGGSGVMIGDAVNIARLQEIGKPLSVIAPNKPTPWSFRSAAESSFEFVASEKMNLENAKVAVKHYASTGKDQQDAWITDSGIVVKLTGGDGVSFALGSYKQYRKLIPELQVEGLGSKRPGTSGK